MGKIGINIITLFALLVLKNITTNAQNIVLPKSSYQKLQMENTWLETNNINAYLFNKFIPLGEFEIGYNIEKGNFKPSQIAKINNNYGFTANKILTINNTVFKGKIEYENQAQKNVGWNARMNQLSENPYMLADSLSGLYKKNYIKICGGLAHTINKNIAAGIDINYMVGDGARIKDPRPKNKLYELEIMPAMIFQKNNLKLGSSLYWKSGREKINYSVVEPMVSYRLFRMLGLGKGRKTVNMQSYIRNYYMKNMGIELQAQFGSNNRNIMFVIMYKHKKESAEDGSSAPKKSDAGDFIEHNIKSYLTFSKKNETYFHKIKIQADYSRYIGTEFIQQAYLDDNITKYRTVTTLDNYRKQSLNPSLHYYLGIGNNELYYKWLIQFNANYIINKTKYVDAAKENFQNINANININRSFELKQSFMNIAATVGSIQNISKELTQLITYSAIQEQAAWTNIVQPNFDFITASVMYCGANIKFARNIKIKKDKQSMAYIDIGTQFAVAHINAEYEQGVNLSIKLGMTF